MRVKDSVAGEDDSEGNGVRDCDDVPVSAPEDDAVSLGLLVMVGRDVFEHKVAEALAEDVSDAGGV